MFLFEPIISLSAVLTILVATIGELVVTLFSAFGNAVTELCTMESNFKDTFNTILFDGSTGIFRNSSSIFDTEDPTKILQAAGNVLLFGLMIIELIKSMFGNYSKAESPERILGKGLLYTIAIVFYDVWTNIILKLVISPIYKSFEGASTGSTVQRALQVLGSALSGAALETGIISLLGGPAVSVFAGAALVRGILLLLLMIPLGIRFITFTIEIVERYLQIFFILLFGPLCLACGVNSNLELVAKKWFAIWLNGMIVICLNVFFVKLSLIAVGNFSTSVASSISSLTTMTQFVKQILVPFFAVYAVMKIASETDNIVNKLGLTNIQASGMGHAIWAGGLSFAAGKVGKAVFGNGKNRGGGGGGDALNAVANAGGAAGAMAAIAAATKGKGILGNAAAAAMAINPTVRGAMIMDQLEKNKGTSGMFDASSQGKNFMNDLLLAAKAGKTGNLNGDESKKKLGEALGLKDGVVVTSAFMKNGQITANLSDGQKIILRPADSASDKYGNSYADRQGIDEKNKIEKDIEGTRWVGYTTGSRNEQNTSESRNSQETPEMAQNNTSENSQSTNTKEMYSESKSEQVSSKEEISHWDQATPVSETEGKDNKFGDNMVETKKNNTDKEPDNNTFLMLSPDVDKNKEEGIAGQMVHVTSADGKFERFDMKPDGTFVPSETGKFFRIKEKDENGNDVFKYINRDRFLNSKEKDSHGNIIPVSYNFANKEVLYKDKEGKIHKMVAGDAVPANFNTYCFSSNGNLMSPSIPNQKIHVGDNPQAVVVLTGKNDAPETVKDTTGKERNIPETDLKRFVNVKNRTAHSSQGHIITCATSYNGMAVVVPSSNENNANIRAVAQRFDDNGAPSPNGRNISIGYDENGNMVTMRVDKARTYGMIDDNDSFEVASGDVYSRLLAKKVECKDPKTKNTYYKFQVTANGETFNINSKDVYSNILRNEENKVRVTDSSGNTFERDYGNDFCRGTSKDDPNKKGGVIKFDKLINRNGEEYYYPSTSGNYVLPNDPNFSLENYMKDHPTYKPGKAPFCKIDDSQVQYGVFGTMTQHYVNGIQTDEHGDVEFGENPVRTARFGDSTTEVVSVHGQTLNVIEGDVKVVRNSSEDGNDPSKDKDVYTVPLSSKSTGTTAQLVPEEGSDSTWTPGRQSAYESEIYERLKAIDFFSENYINLTKQEVTFAQQELDPSSGIVTTSVNVDENGKKSSQKIDFYRTDMWEPVEGVEKPKEVTLPDGKKYYVMLRKAANAKYLKKLQRIIRKNGRGINSHQ